MGQIDRCRKEDIPAVARLHLRVYGNSNNESVEDLESYYQKVLFGHPWRDEESPSLIFRLEDGGVEGLLGVMVRRMVYKGKPIRMAVPHSLMVAPDCSSPMAAIQMARKFFEGAQDLVVGDGANDQSRKLLEAMGAGTSCLYSMYWLCLLRPCSYAGSALGAKRGIKLLTLASRPACLFADSLAGRFWRRSIQSRQPEESTVSEVDSRALLLSVKDFPCRSPLHPEYCETDLQGMADFLGGVSGHGQSQGIEVRNAKGQRIGTCLYRIGARKAMEVLLLLARDDSADVVFGRVLEHALNLGVTSVGGRMDPRFFQSMSDYACLIRRRSWVVVYSRNPEILDVIHRGDAVLSALDGEFVLTSR